MSSILHATIENWWKEVCKKVKKSVVFIDEPAAESLHWNGGLARLKEASILSVREFSTFEKGSDNEKKAVFIVTGPIVNMTADILESIIRNSSFEYCQVITNASSAVHKLAKYPGRDIEENKVFVELEDNMLEWMGNFNYTSEVFYIPLHAISLTPELFVLPAFRQVFPFLRCDIDKAKDLYQLRNKGQQYPVAEYDGILYQTLPCETQVGVTHLVSALNSLFQSLSIQEDIFTIGSYSRLIGEQLEMLQVAKSRRKTASQKISLILVDRTLDVATPSSVNNTNALDQIKATLEPLSGHFNDVQINLSPLFGIDPKGNQDTFPPGSLDGWRTPGVENPLLKKLIFLEKKDFALEILKEAKSRGYDLQKDESLQDNLEELVNLIANDFEQLTKNMDLLQIARAFCLADSLVKEKGLQQLEEISTSFVKTMSKNLKNSKNYLSKVTKMIRSRHERGLSLDDILLLITNLYAFLPAGDRFYDEDEDRLQSALSEAIVKDKDNLPPIMEKMVNYRDVDEILAFQIVKAIFQKLSSVSACRENLSRYKRLDDSGKAFGLLEQLFQDIFADDRREIPDLVHRTGGLGGLLKSGIGLFGMNVSKMHPRENPSLWVIVIGGITASEAQSIKNIAETKSKCELVIGSTCVTSPKRIMESLFIDDTLFAYE